MQFTYITRPFLSFQVHGIRIQPRHSRDGVGHLVTKSAQRLNQPLEGGKRACCHVFWEPEINDLKTKKDIVSSYSYMQRSMSSIWTAVFHPSRKFQIQKTKMMLQGNQRKHHLYGTWKAAAGYSKWYCTPRSLGEIRDHPRHSLLWFGEKPKDIVFEWLKQSMHYILFQRKQNIIQTLIPKLKYIYIHIEIYRYLYMKIDISSSSSSAPDISSSHRRGSQILPKWTGRLALKPLAAQPMGPSQVGLVKSPFLP